MSERNVKKLKVIAFVLLGLTAAMTLIGGIGTICVAWFPENWEKFHVLIDYKPIYQAATVVTIIDGLVGIWIAYNLIGKGRKWAYAAAIVFMAVGLLTAGVKMYYSSQLRGSTAPTNIRFYLTVVALVVLLILRTPGIWEKLALDGKGNGSGKVAAGLTMMVAGLVTVTTRFWAGPTHVVNGYNLVDVLAVPLLAIGGILIFGGAWLLFVKFSPMRAADLTSR